MAIKFNNNEVRSINYVDSSNTSNTVYKVIKDGTIVWVKPYLFSMPTNDNLMNLAFESKNGVVVTKFYLKGLYYISGYPNYPTTITTQFTFPEPGTYYVRNFNYLSSDIAKCFLSAFSDSTYPNNYYLEGSTLTFNITTANTTCNFCIYSVPQNGISLDQILKIYIGKTNVTEYETSLATSGQITETEEPSASTGYIENGDDVHHGDTFRGSYIDGSQSFTNTFWAYNGSITLSSSDITGNFQGNYGFTVKNNNIPDCTVYWYAEYWNQSAPYGPYIRNPSSGWASGGVVSGNGGTLHVHGCIPTGTVQRKIYIKLGSIVSQKSRTYTLDYVGLVKGLLGSQTQRALIDTGLYSNTTIGTVKGSVMITSATSEQLTPISETGTTKSIETALIVYRP